MSGETVEAVQRLYESFNLACESGDFGPYIEEFFAEEIVFEAGGTEGFMLEGTARGHDGIKRFYESWMEVMESVRLEPVEIVKAGDRVVVPVRVSGRMRHTGLEAPAGISFVHVYTMRYGKAARVQLYGNKAEALADVGV